MCGAALGTYNTLQSLGLFAGGALGGGVLRWGGAPVLFLVTGLLCLCWLAVAWGMRPVPPQAGRGRH